MTNNNPSVEPQANYRAFEDHGKFYVTNDAGWIPAECVTMGLAQEFAVMMNRKVEAQAVDHEKLRQAAERAVAELGKYPTNLDDVDNCIDSLTDYRRKSSPGKILKVLSRLALLEGENQRLRDSNDGNFNQLSIEVGDRMHAEDDLRLAQADLSQAQRRITELEKALALAESDNERLQRASRTRPDYDLRCQDCGAAHNLDTSLPSAIWNQVAKPEDVLCTLCIDERLERAGIECDQAEFYFVGKALMSKMYAESHGEIAYLKAQLAQAQAGNEALNANITTLTAYNREMRREIEQAQSRHKCDPQYDATDAACACWWRAHDHTTRIFCQHVNEILDSKDDGAGANGESWGSTRKRLLGLQAEAEKVGQAVRDECSGALRERAKQYPADIFPADSEVRDAIAGTVLRRMLPILADRLGEIDIPTIIARVRDGQKEGKQ